MGTELPEIEIEMIVWSLKGHAKGFWLQLQAVAGRKVDGWKERDQRRQERGKGRDQEAGR